MSNFNNYKYVASKKVQQGKYKFYPINNEYDENTKIIAGLIVIFGGAIVITCLIILVIYGGK